MVRVLRQCGDLLRRLWRLLVLFAVLRITLGAAVLLLFERDAVAWGPELTAVVLAALLIYVAVALVLRGAGTRASRG